LARKYSRLLERLERRDTHELAVHRELSGRREALLNRERLRVLGELAASIAHDLGNTLRGASFQLAALRETSLTAKKRAQALRAVAQRIELASEAIARMHDFARNGVIGESVVRLDRVVTKAAALLEIEFRSSGNPVNVVISMPELPPVRGSLSELSLMFVNLLRNARDAMPEGGTIRVSARRRGQSIVVMVSDEGTGIPAAVQRHLFEPFFTTKTEQGTGLGLWLAAGTMERLGGSIRAVNRRGAGALFVLTFPLDALHRRARPRASPRRIRRGRRSR
jgi:signal transduction histidine kinase